MVDFQKAHFSSDGDNVTLTMPISKVDKEKRIVSGFATLDNIDRQGDTVTSEASRKAFENFRGNVRLMHQPIPAGKVVNFRQESFFNKEDNKQYSGVFVDTYISKGADNVWEMVLDGTLTGFSIGGNIKDSEMVFDKSIDKNVRIIKDYDLVELSLVDSPANQLANIFSIQKTESGTAIADGIFNKSDIQNVFWCETDQMAFTDIAETKDCLLCEKSLENIGWIDVLDSDDLTKSISIIVDSFEKVENVNTITSEDVIDEYPEQGKFKSGVKRTRKSDLLHSDVAEQAIESQSVADQITKGGVEVAENETVEETVEDVEVAKTDDIVDETAEVVEKSDETETSDDTSTPEEESVEKADAGEAADASTENGEAADEINKSFNEFVVNVTEHNERTAEAINTLASAVADVTKALTGKYDELSKALADINSVIGEVNSRVNSLEDDSAVKKSGEFTTAPEETTIRKSKWGGRFLGSTELFN